MYENQNEIFVTSEEVSKALDAKSPIVALESTIITHGLPFPDNWELAIKAEDTVRSYGCTPATIAVINGKVKIGLTHGDIDNLAKGKNLSKLSTSNLSISIAKEEMGSTTVAATLVAANLIGIQVFATGGIGGAHRGSELNFDISADLQQLSKTKINLICAGPKAILDIPKTVEILETLGVPLITYKSKNIPAFWSFDSGIKSPNIVQNINQIVKSYQTRLLLGLQGGQLICNPIPKSDEISKDIIEPLIDLAVKEATAKKITGKDLTPFLLSKIKASTDGKSLIANKILFLNNVALASRLAKKLSKFSN